MLPRHPFALSGKAVRRGAAGVALATAAVLTLTGTEAASATSAPNVAAHSPSGTVHVSVMNHFVRVFGTASDPDARGPITLRVRFPREGVKTVRTDAATHAYSARFFLPVGRRYVVVRALNQGAGRSRVIGSRWVTVYAPQSRNPRGTVRVVRHGHRAWFSGTAWDPDTPGGSIEVLLWRNTTLVARTWTNGRTRAFAFAPTGIRPGVNTMTVVAVNRWSGTWNTHLRRVELGRVASWMLRYHGNQRIAAMMLPHYGWGPAQMRALVAMWNEESGWRTRAENGSSGAYGIPQACPGGKMASAGADWRTDPATQIRWGLDYIRARYGSPTSAWSSHLAYGSY